MGWGDTPGHELFDAGAASCHHQRNRRIAKIEDGLILTHVEEHTFERVILFLESEDELKESLLLGDEIDGTFRMGVFTDVKLRVVSMIRTDHSLVLLGRILFVARGTFYF
jgi:hypothetical protein